MKASDLFLKCLAAQGVTAIFGVPGEENADLMMSLKNSPIDFIICRHEQTAAFMADMHGRLTGMPGVCLSTLGPGATNLMTGVVSANLDYSPLVAIIGQASTKRLHKESHQNMDAVNMYDPVTKWATTIRDGEVIPEVVRKAFKVATHGKPGAVLIELPEDIAKVDVDVPVVEQMFASDQRGASVTEIDHVLSLIAESQAPLLLVGGGCVREEADKELKQFLDHTNIYAADTFMGKGAVSARYKHALRCVGLGMKDIALHAFDRADLVICVGYDMIEWHPDRWNADHHANVIHIDTTMAEVDKNYLPTAELVGNIKSILSAINQRLSDKHKKDPAIFADVREDVFKDLETYDQDYEFPVKPQKMLYDLRNTMADTDILISDVGAHKMWVARQYPAYQSKTCFISNGFCSMGFAMPSAVEAKRLYPDRHVVALCGDGGFIMSIQALVTAVHYQLPITVIVWEDEAYGLIQWKQEMEYQQHSYIQLKNPDLMVLAKAFGCHSQRITSVAEIKPALQQAFTIKDKPTVIIIPIDYRENMKLTKHLGEIICR